MCVASPTLLADLDVANPDSYVRPVASPQQGLASVFPAEGSPHLAPTHLPDYGLCAYDAGLVANLTDGLDRGSFASDRLVLAPARWYAEAEPEAPVLHSPGLTWRTTTDTGGILPVSVAGLDGNFGLAGETWNVLPRRYRRGYTVEMAVYVGPVAVDGTLFYWGTRAANKFWQVLDYVGTPYRLNTGVPLEEVHPEDPAEGLQLHALSLRLVAGGALQVRWLDERGELGQVQTATGVVSQGWQHLVLSWCPTQLLPEDPEVADCWPFRRGVLRLVVNGRQRLVHEGMPELRHRDLAGPAAQQYSVPYYLSWGAGAPGWSHAWVPADAQGTPEPLVFDPTRLDEAFGGVATGVGLRRLRVYEGAVTPLVARQLATQYEPALVWGSLDPLLASGW